MHITNRMMHSPTVIGHPVPGAALLTNDLDVTHVDDGVEGGVHGDLTAVLALHSKVHVVDDDTLGSGQRHLSVGGTADSIP